MMRSINARITGLVQGVGFRYWALGAATTHGVYGWVRNEPDSSVSAHIEGDAEAVSAMVSALWKGPRWGHVENIEVSDSSFEGYQDFGVR
ncbi:MAG: acylphosphatase [Ancrocorticia sp.]|uniref:acylphosphatase n=1 Tax=Ancrocorticia sp. TaxID=2593684 RepID=UPI003F911D02